MAGVLRGVAGSARCALQAQLSPCAGAHALPSSVLCVPRAEQRPVSGAQQRRALGDLPYKPNKFLEDWGTAREHIELTYRWDGKTLRNVAMWMVVFPYFVYNITCFEFQKSDNKFGRTTRHFWGFE